MIFLWRPGARAHLILAAATKEREFYRFHGSGSTPVALEIGQEFNGLRRVKYFPASTQLRVFQA